MYAFGSLLTWALAEISSNRWWACEVTNDFGELDPSVMLLDMVLDLVGVFDLGFSGSMDPNGVFLMWGQRNSEGCQEPSVCGREPCFGLVASFISVRRVQISDDEPAHLPF